MTDTIAAAESARPGTASPFWLRVRVVALWSVGLGLCLEALSLAIAASFLVHPTAAQIAADLVQRTSWSFLVCLGIVAGSAARAARAAVMGVLGLVSGPLAFGAARALHKAMQHALAAGPPAPGALTPLEIGCVKAVEYGAFGVLLAAVSRRPGAPLRSYLSAGLAVGVVFGGALLAWMSARALDPLPFSELCVRGANELVFPVGCAFVLYVSQRAAAAAT